MQRRTLTTLAAAVGAVLLALTPTVSFANDAPSAPANLSRTVTAAAGDEIPPVPDVTPVADHLIVDGVRVNVTVMSDFDTSGPVLILNSKGVETGTITQPGVVVSDRAAGKPQSRAALAGCSWTSWVAPGDTLWHQSLPGCSYIGTTNTTTAGYEVTTDFNSAGSGCAQILGYHLTWVSTGGYQWTGFWSGIGCVPSGSSGTGTVLWGNVASSKRILVKSGGGPAGAAGMFQ